MKLWSNTGVIKFSAPRVRQEYSEVNKYPKVSGPGCSRGATVSYQERGLGAVIPPISVWKGASGEPQGYQVPSVGRFFCPRVISKWSSAKKSANICDAYLVLCIQEKTCCSGIYEMHTCNLSHMEALIHIYTLRTWAAAKWVKKFGKQQTWDIYLGTIPQTLWCLPFHRPEVRELWKCMHVRVLL